MKGKVSKRNANPWAGRLRAGVRVAAAVAKGARHIKKSRSRLSRKASRGDGDVLTNQFDTKLTYVRKGRGKRRSTKFARKVQRVLEDNVSSHIYTTNTATNVSSTAGSQYYLDCGLFQIDGTAGGSNQDIENIFTGYTNNAYGDKLHFTNAHMDLIMQNAGSQVAIVDVYCFEPKKDLQYTSSVQGNASSYFLYTASKIGAPYQTPSGTGAGLGTLVPGTGPFENSPFCRLFTVLEKRRFVLTGGQVATMELKVHPRRHKPMSADSWNNQAGTTNYQYYKKGFSKGYLIFFWGAGVDNGPSGASTYPVANMAFTVQKSYKFKKITPAQTVANDTGLGLSAYTSGL